jgi:outer membrane protein assembly factor BamB/tetratricopeptide (TPR) repeat protein
MRSRPILPLDGAGSGDAEAHIPTMTALKGNLNTVDLANIFQMLSLNQCEGTLYIFEGASRKAIYFAKDGVSMLSRGRPRADALGRILVRLDRVTPEQLDLALARQAENGRLLGQVLVDANACTRADVEECVEIQIREEVCRLFLWKDAQFEFVEGEPAEEFRKEGVQRLTFSVNGIIVEAAKRVDEWEWIQRVVPDTAEIYAYTGKNVDLADSVFSEPWAGKVLAAIDGKRSVEEAIEASCVNKFEVCKILALLVEGGAVDRLPPEQLVKEADAAAAAGDGAATAKFLERLRAAQGDAPETHLRLGEAYESMRELEKAARHFGIYAEGRAEAGDAKSAFTTYRRICSFLTTDLAAADRMIELFARAPAGLEEHAKEMLERGKRLSETYVELKRGSRAVQVLERVAALGADDPDLRNRLIAVYVAAGMNAQAITEYEALADAALARKDLDGAEAICRRILALDRDRADVAARIEQVVAKRRFRQRGIRGLLVAAGVVAAGSIAVWQGLAWYRGRKAEQAQIETDAQDRLHAVRAATAPVIRELDALMRELAARQPEPAMAAASLKERMPRIVAAQKSAAEAAAPIADLCERCAGLPSEEDSQALAFDVSSRVETLEARIEEIRKAARESAEAHFDQAEQMLAKVENTRAVLEHVDLAVKIAEDCDGRLPTENGAAWRELQTQLRAYVDKFDETKATVEHRIADGDVEGAYDVAVAYLVDKDFPPPDLRAAMPLPVRLVTRPAGARVTTRDGADTGLVAGPDCVATISLFTGAAFEFDLPGFEKASVTIPAVKEVDGALIRDRIKRQYELTLEKTQAFRRATSDGRAVASAPFASERFLVVPSSRACDVVDVAKRRVVATLPLQAQLGLRAAGAVVPVDGADIVVLPTADGHLSFFDAATGASRGTWSESHGAVTFELGRSGTDVVAADDRGGLYCIDVGRRTKRWGGQALLENGEPTYFSSAPVVVGGSVYIGCEDGSVRVVGVADGTAMGHFPPPEKDSGRVGAPVAVDGGYAYVVSRAGSRSTRVTKWRVATAHPEWSTVVAGDCKSAAAPHGGEVFVVTINGEVHGLSAADGKPTRSALVARGIKVVGEATLDGDLLYVGADDGVLHAVDLSSPGIEARWRFVVKSPAGKSAGITTRCVVAAGLILFGAADSAVYALERAK